MAEIFEISDIIGLSDLLTHVLFFTTYVPSKSLSIFSSINNNENNIFKISIVIFSVYSIISNSRKMIKNRKSNIYINTRIILSIISILLILSKKNKFIHYILSLELLSEITYVLLDFF